MFGPVIRDIHVQTRTPEACEDVALRRTILQGPEYTETHGGNTPPGVIILP